MTQFKGFTLIEVLIAMAIFAIVSAMTFQGLQTSMYVQQKVEGRSDELNDIQLLMTLMFDDFLNISLRPIREALGDKERPHLERDVEEYSATNSYDCQIAFTRGGAEPGGLIRAGIYRVAYCQQADKLYRLSWPVLDRAQDSNPAETLLLQRVEQFEIEMGNEIEEGLIISAPLSKTEEANAEDNIIKVTLGLLNDEGGVRTFTRLFRYLQTPHHLQ